jgi:hypothetical protein
VVLSGGVCDHNPPDSDQGLERQSWVALGGG